MEHRVSYKKDREKFVLLYLGCMMYELMEL